jgi:hypothetical protein
MLVTEQAGSVRQGFISVHCSNVFPEYIVHWMRVIEGIIEKQDNAGFPKLFQSMPIELPVSDN